MKNTALSPRAAVNRFLGLAKFKNRTLRRRVSRQTVSIAAESVEDRTLLCSAAGPDPNDQICEPVDVIANGQTVTGAVGNGLGALDVDLFELEIPSSLVGQEITFTLNTTDTDSDPLDTYLRLFDDAGDELDDDEDGGPGNNSQIDFEFDVAGTYYLGVSTSGNEEYSAVTGEGDDTDRFSGIGQYELTFEDTDDQIDEANTLLNSFSPLPGVIDVATDVDLYQFDGVAGQSFRFEVDGNADPNGFGLDSFLRIFDDNGDQLDADDDGGSGFRDSEITFTFPDTDDFYLGVSSFQNQFYDIEDGTGDSSTATNTGIYTISATEVSLDPDDRLSNAIDLGDLFVDGTLELDDLEIATDADVDMFQFVVGRDGSFVEIDIDRPTTGVDSFIRLFDSNGTPIDSNDDANAPGESGALARDSFLGLELDAGTYFVGVSAFRNTAYDPNTGLGDTDGDSTGSYSIQIQDRLHVDTADDSQGVFTLDANDNKNTLREAIEFANERSGRQEITFQLNEFLGGSTITLAGQPLDSEQLEITDDVTITGPGADILSVSGDDDNRVFLVDDGDDDSEIDVTISGLTIRDGNTVNVDTADPGAGIKNTENLTLSEVAVVGNAADSPDPVGDDGGGVHHSLGTLNVEGSTFNGNSAFRGAGVEVSSGSANISNSTFSGNSALIVGAGVHVANSATVTIRSSTITGNRANSDGFSSENRGGGLFSQSNNPVTLHNTIVAGNLTGTPVRESESDIRIASNATVSSSSSHNLIGVSSPGITNGVNGNIAGDGSGGVIPIETILDTTLADNGGATLTHALVDGGLAVGAGSNTQIPSGVTTDQTGAARIQFDTVDIGAVESSFETPGLQVTTVDDDDDPTDGETSLREAIDFANVNPGADTITFAIFFGFSEHTINLNGTQLPTVTDDLTITGPGQELLTIDANDSSRHLKIKGADVTISGVTLTDGNTTENGGAIFADQGTTLTIDASTISSSVASSGGGILMDGGQLNVINGSLLTANRATDGNRGGGGAVFADNAVVAIDASTVSNNTAFLGGGIAMLNGTLNVKNGSTLGGDTEAEGNKATNDGGAISAQGASVTIDGSTVSANSAVAGGGILMVGGDLTVQNGSLLGGDTEAEGNKATDDGGAISAQGDASVTIDDSTVSANIADVDGGAIFAQGGALTVQNGSLLGGDTEAEGNKATDDGGAIFAQGGASVTIDDSTVSANIADVDGGGIFMNGGDLTVQNGSLLGGDTEAKGNKATDDGGAIFAQSGASVTIDGSTVSRNSAEDKGGAVFVPSSTVSSSLIVNSTFSSNSAGDRAGALNVESPTVIRNSTFTGNRADSDGNGTGARGGIFTIADRLTMHNTIVAGNFKGTGTTPSDLDSGTSLIAGSSHNLIGSADGGSGGLVDGVDGNIVGVNGSGTRDINTILNTTLADNGGPTLTHALVAGSPAVDNGNNDEAVDADDNALTTDQRGTGFDRIKFGTVDIGAIEAQDVDPVFIDAAGVLTILGSPESDTVTVTTDATTTTVSTNFTDDDFEFANDAYTSVRIEGKAGDDDLSATVGVPTEMFGEDGDDTLSGGAANDTLDGGDGNDSLVGGDGADSLLAGPGKDTVFGGTGNDTMHGGGGNDRFEGEGGNDVAFGDGGKDSLFGGDGNDSLEGGGSADRLYGNNDNDTLVGGSGGDFFSAHDGDDVLRGDGGDDSLNSGDGNDELLGGEGGDTLNAGYGLDTLRGEAGLDVLIAGPGADELFGGDNSDSMSGGGGGDTLWGGGGNDTLLGGAGKDVLRGEENSDSLDGGSGPDDLTGASGNDTLNGASGNDTLQGNSGSDKLSGGNNSDSLLGGTGNDELLGGSGNNILRGDSGNDTLIGGGNSDSLVGGSGNDELIGGSGNDTLNGSSGDDSIVGGGGADIANGGSGDDSIVGSGGGDSLRGSTGNDLIIGSGGADTLRGDAGNDAVFGGAGVDSLTGGDGEDLLVGYDSSMSTADFEAVHTEWTSGNTYQQRVNNLRNGSGTTGGGANGTVFLPAVLTEDSETDRLLGMDDLDYFWGTAAEADDFLTGEIRDEL